MSVSPAMFDRPHKTRHRVFTALRTMAGPAHARCERCRATLPQQHDHLLNLQNDALLCACLPCAENPGPGCLRLPRKPVKLDRALISDAQWHGLGIPIHLAFIRERGGAAVAVYPSPAGPLESSLDADLWAEVLQGAPSLRELDWRVEALLVYRLRSDHKLFRVPLDRAFELSGLIREAWEGFSGGPRVWERIAGFMATLEQDAANR